MMYIMFQIIDWFWRTNGTCGMTLSGQQENNENKSSAYLAWHSLVLRRITFSTVFLLLNSSELLLIHIPRILLHSS